MRRGEFDDLAAFAVVASELSFRRAASRIGVTPSALSHTIRLLEERVGTRLLNRTTRSVALTDAGRRLLEQLQPAIGQIESALQSLDAERERPAGRLRIYATQLSAMAVIAPIWRRYLTTFPDVQLELDVGEASIDFVASGFDAAIWSRHRAQQDMVAVRVSTRIRAVLVASGSYFAKRSVPRVPRDLAQHDCVQYRRGSEAAPIAWHFERQGEWHEITVSGKVMVNNHDMNLRAALDGLGIAYSFDAYAAPHIRSGELICVLEEWAPTSDGLFLFYPGHRQVPAALRALIDMIVANRDLKLPAEL
jgi:DNA-binding transcriptional LysR family regulator